MDLAENRKKRRFTRYLAQNFKSLLMSLNSVSGIEIKLMAHFWMMSKIVLDKLAKASKIDCLI